jgi:membrane-associated phospholipid phosphatase
MYFLAELGNKSGLGFVVLFSKHFGTNAQAFTAIVAFTLTSAFNTCEKMVLMEPRPYFLTKVAPLSCKDLEFGNPSGHAMVVTALYMTITAKMDFKIKATVLLTCVVVALNRFFMGVHSLD